MYICIYVMHFQVTIVCSSEPQKAVDSQTTAKLLGNPQAMKMALAGVTSVLVRAVQSVMAVLSNPANSHLIKDASETAVKSRIIVTDTHDQSVRY